MKAIGENGKDFMIDLQTARNSYKKEEHDDVAFIPSEQNLFNPLEMVKH